MIDWYEGEDKWHQRILIWKGSGEHGWFVLTPDHDLYEQSYALAGDDGPVKFKIKGRHFNYYSRVSAPVYKFAAEPSEADMRGYIEAALDELGHDTVPADGWRPSEVKVARHSVSTSVLLGRRFVPRRITRGQGIIQATQAEGESHELLPELRPRLKGLRVAPTNFMWAALTPGLSRRARPAFEVVVEDGKGMQFGDSNGMYFHGLFGWVPVFLVRVSDAPDRFRQHLATETVKKDDVQVAAGEVAGRQLRGWLWMPGCWRLIIMLPVSGISPGRSLFLRLRITASTTGLWRVPFPQLIFFVTSKSSVATRSAGWPSGCVQSRSMKETEWPSKCVHWWIVSILQAATINLTCPRWPAWRSWLDDCKGIVDAYSAGAPNNPDSSSARVITGYKGAEDAISPALRTWAARRNKVRDHRRGLQVPTAVEEAAASAVADSPSECGAEAQGPGADSPGWPVILWRRVVFPVLLAMAFNPGLRVLPLTLDAVIVTLCPCHTCLSQPRSFAGG